MLNKLRGYSFIEIILVTTFIIIFLVVINPGTYIDRFSKILLKINVLNESSMMVNKLNSFNYQSCSSIVMQNSAWQFINNQESLSLRFEDDTFRIKNLLTSVDAILYKFVDSSKTNSFFYYDSYFFPTVSLSNVQFIDVIFYSSLMDHKVIGSTLCKEPAITLGGFE